MAGVGRLIHKRREQAIYDWKAWTERILTIELRELNKSIKTVIVVYGPNDDDKAENKDKFWEELTTVVEGARGMIIIIGDFNSRVGKKDGIHNRTIGKHGENVRNNNGKRMLDFCLMNDYVITNTLFQHKDIHKYTREVTSRGERSIIDFILVENKNRKIVMDTKVKRGPEIGSDHYVVIAKIREENGMRENRKNGKGKTTTETIKSYKLRNKHIARKYEENNNRKDTEHKNKLRE